MRMHSLAKSSNSIAGIPLEYQPRRNVACDAHHRGRLTWRPPLTTPVAAGCFSPPSEQFFFGIIPLGRARQDQPGLGSLFRYDPAMPTDYERQQLEATKRLIEQTRRDRDELAEQIRSSKETIAESEKTLARIDRLLADLEGKKP